MQITNIPGWSGLLMQTNATIPTRWSVLGVPPPTPPPPDIYFICLVAHISSCSLVGWRSETLLQTANYWSRTQRGNTRAGAADSRQEVEPGFSEWRRITEVWVLSAIIRVVQGELTLPSLTLSCRQTSVRPPCQARLVWPASPQVRCWTCN